MFGWFRRPLKQDFITVGDLRNSLRGLPKDMMIAQWTGGGARLFRGGRLYLMAACQSKDTPRILTSKAQSDFMQSPDDGPPKEVLIIGDGL